MFAEWPDKKVLAFYDAFPETTLGDLCKLSNRGFSDLIKLLSTHR